jgi:hypothetical protein
MVRGVMSLYAIILRARKVVHGKTQEGRYDPIPPNGRATDQEIIEDLRDQIANSGDC